MLRSVLSAVLLAGVLALVQPAFADPLPATASEHALVAAAATEQPVSRPAPAASAVERGVAPAGFGWG